jgi:hypothetical protein
VTPYLKSSALRARTFRSNATIEIISGLTANRTYRFRVAARNAVGLGSLSPFSNAVTTAAARPPNG